MPRKKSHSESVESGEREEKVYDEPSSTRIPLTFEIIQLVPIRKILRLK